MSTIYKLNFLSQQNAIKLLAIYEFNFIIAIAADIAVAIAIAIDVTIATTAAVAIAIITNVALTGFRL